MMFSDGILVLSLPRLSKDPVCRTLVRQSLRLILLDRADEQI